MSSLAMQDNKQPHLALDVQKLDSAIHRINLYPVDNY